MCWRFGYNEVIVMTREASVTSKMSTAGKSHLWRMIQIAMEAQDFYQSHLEHLQNIPENEESITPAMHNTLVDRTRSWNRFYNLSPETFFLAVNVMDRFLSLVKARPHHLMCVTVASYYLSVKMLEHSQDLMSPEDLIRITQCGCTPSDIARMENIILQKLGWDMEAPTPLSFLQLFHAYCVVSNILGMDTGLQTDHLDIMTRKLEACMCHFPLTLFKPSILAMSLLISELPDFIKANCNISHMGWSTVVADLQYSIKMSDCELLECQTVFSEFLATYSSPECKMPTSRLSWIISSRTARQLRFSAQLASTLAPIPEHDGSLTDENWSDSSMNNTTYSKSSEESSFTTSSNHPSPNIMEDSTAPSLDPNRDRCLLWDKSMMFRYENEKVALCPVICTCVER
ncbi:cyclin-G2-like isoform X2 [Acanthaster planci]|uniref:Cyclin-G2-like isoform X2 n=3 Tax=Acanthaster planci TaxID=133434 RepID=A0A8B7Z286_ACAPL|nr:cyclin-G2-like isoform X2 [Acanthaster planci]